ncbi:hypothetical protein FHS70_004650 [Flammeovirga yaeyamensis]|nr:hypothetical protein [Flammeovirga yaeyamensis]
MHLDFRTRFYVGLLIVTMSFVIFILLASHFGVDLGRFIYHELIFNVVLAVMSFEITCLGADTGNGPTFHTFYMATVLIRLVLSLTVFILFFLKANADKTEKLSFILCFFFFYFAYTIFEIICLYHKLQGKSGK